MAYCTNCGVDIGTTGGRWTKTHRLVCDDCRVALDGKQAKEEADRATMIKSLQGIEALLKKSNSRSDEGHAIKYNIEQQTESIRALGEEVRQLQGLLRFGLREDLAKASDFCRKLKSIIREGTNSFSSKATILVHITNSMEWYYLDPENLRGLFESEGISLTSADMLVLSDPKDLAGILTTHTEMETLLIRDNAENASLTPVREMLCKAGSKGEIPWVIGQGRATRSIDIAVPSYIYVIVSGNKAVLDLYSEHMKSLNTEIALFRESI